MAGHCQLPQGHKREKGLSWTNEKAADCGTCMGKEAARSGAADRKEDWQEYPLCGAYYDNTAAVGLPLGRCFLFLFFLKKLGIQQTLLLFYNVILVEQYSVDE